MVAFPVPSSTVSLWRANLHALSDHRSTPGLPAKVDTAVIGAGYAGYLLPTISSSAHLRPDTYSRPSALAVSHGVEAAAEVAKFEADDLPAVSKDGIQLLKKNNFSALEDIFCAEKHEAEQLVVSLLSKALEAGASLQTHTPVSEVSEEPESKGYFTTMTAMRGKVRTKNVVHIVPAGKPFSPSLSNSYIIRPGALEYYCFIPSTDGSIVVGGARSKCLGDRESWYDSVEDDKLIESAKTYFDGYMQRSFRRWEDSSAYTQLMGCSADGLPHVGAVPGRRNQLMLAGFSGYGMPQAFLGTEGGRSDSVTGRGLQEHRNP
ncbi:hypothetical protein DL770_001022 [Monosporascus sp. CRB-9-2]|nr:hypothetical protein DL770_001022 [Monosporascus sp. CRB-9-2]